MVAVVPVHSDLAAPTPVDPLRARPLKVRFVEDDPDDVDRMLTELRAAGFDPDWRRVHTPEGFTAHFLPGLDVVLSAYTLKTIDPMWMLQQVREAGHGVPLIIVSGVIGDENAAACLKLGATDYILKDRLARLGSAIDRVMEDREAKTAKRQAEAEKHLATQAAEEQARNVDLLRARNEFKSQFLNMVAHDLNNVVTPMRINLHGLRAAAARGELPPHEKAIAMLDNGLHRMEAFLADLRDAARLQSGQLALCPKPIDLGPRVTSAVELARAQADEARVAIQADLDPGIVVQADATRIDQVLTNLLGNAIKFTPAGGRITVVLRPSEHGAQLSVIDSGIGLDKADIPLLFQPFTRLAAGQGRHTGTGLGLFICRGIVESHEGRIWAESEGHDRGSTFFVWLPTTPPKGTAPSAAA
jgi:signal transduction histidine kinase